MSDNTGPITHAEARQILSRFNASHWMSTEQEHARYTIPGDPRRDDDIRLAAYIDQCEAALAKREHYPRFWFTGTHEHSSVIFFQFSPECAVRCVGTDIGSKVRESVFAANELSSPRIYPETSKQ